MFQQPRLQEEACGTPSPPSGHGGGPPPIIALLWEGTGPGQVAVLGRGYRAQISFPDWKEVPTLGHMMSQDTGPRAGQPWWAKRGTPTHLSVPRLQSAQGPQGRDLPVERTGGSSGHQAGIMDGQRPQERDRWAAPHFCGGLLWASCEARGTHQDQGSAEEAHSPSQSLLQAQSTAQHPHELPPAQQYQSALWHQPQCKPGQLGDHRGPLGASSKHQMKRKFLYCVQAGRTRPGSPHPQQRLQEADRSEIKVDRENA